MNGGNSWAVSATVALIATVAGPSYSGTQDCRGLVGMAIQDALVTETDNITSSFVVASLDSRRGVTVNSPFCRVRGVITPSSDSNINFEVWLPPA
ncbi:MAG: hypothetical protein JO061_03210, partial [Acidobacteriaceae bacterium]|nr:hypothetical protein [Acidobacteriaceae bacterium]